MSDVGTYRLREADELDFDSDSEDEDDSLEEDDPTSRRDADLQSKFMPYGPPAVLVAGFREHELGLVRLPVPSPQRQSRSSASKSDV